MKKLFLIVCAAAVFVGCHSTKKETAKMNEPAGAQYQTNAVMTGGAGVWTTDVR